MIKFFLTLKGRLAQYLQLVCYAEVSDSDHSISRYYIQKCNDKHPLKDIKYTLNFMVNKPVFNFKINTISLNYNKFLKQNPVKCVNV